MNRLTLYFTVLALSLPIVTTANVVSLPATSGTGSAQANRHELQAIPSQFWPQYVTTVRPVAVDEDTEIPAGTRGVLQRCETHAVLVDFGRWGVHPVDPLATDFFEGLLAVMKGEAVKDFPNLTFQIGNKLMHFGPDKTPRRIQMSAVKDTRHYLLLYLGEYDPAGVDALRDFGANYGEHLQALSPELTVAVFPASRRYYDFGYTVGFPVPFIFPHMRTGYIESLSHTGPHLPKLVLVDAEGALIYETHGPMKWSELSSKISEALARIDQAYPAAVSSSRRSAQRAASWLAR